MDPADSHTAVLTVEQVKTWVRERADLASRVREAYQELLEADRRLDSLSAALPHIQPLIGTREAIAFEASSVGSDTRFTRESGFRTSRDGSVALTQACLELLSTQNGGRSIRWIRSQVEEMPDQRSKLISSPAGLSNALHRLRERKLVVMCDGMYYHADIYDRIQSGDLKEERVENPAARSFASEMERVFTEMGGRGVAAEVVRAAKADAVTGQMISKGALNVYRWLTRRVSMRALAKDGDVYRLASLPPHIAHTNDPKQMEAPM